MGSSVEEEYGYLREKSWDKPNEQISHIISRERKVSMTGKPRYHTPENHEYHMKKWKRCVYCDNGVPIKDRDEINKEVL
jgi:hypothetical protein